MAALAFLGSSSASAHGILGDADPGRDVYVLPGALVSPGLRPCCATRDDGFIDLGIEVSAHRFVPKTGRIFDQLGYGAVFQLQLGGIPVDDPAGELGPSLPARRARTTRAPSASSAASSPRSGSRRSGSRSTSRSSISAKERACLCSRPCRAR